MQFRSGANPSAIEVDHIVPLAYGFVHGASSLSESVRVNFANDPLNLQSVSRAENQKKSDKGPSEYLPPNRAAECGYVAAQTAVLRAYNLTVTAQDKAVILRVLTSCPRGFPVPTRESSYTQAPVRLR